MNTRKANFLVIECPFSPYMRIYRVQSDRVHISLVDFIILNANAFVYTLCCCDIVRARADKFLRVPADNDNNKPYRLLIAINKKEKCTLCLHYYSHQMALSYECLFFFFFCFDLLAVIDAFFRKGLVRRADMLQILRLSRPPKHIYML